MSLNKLQEFENRFFIIKGDIKTHIINLDLSKIRFDLLLNNYLIKELNYDVVAFIDSRGLYFLDENSRNKAMTPKSKQNKKVKNKKLLKRPRGIRTTPIETTSINNLKMRYTFNNAFSFLVDQIINLYKNYQLNTAIILYDDSNLRNQINSKAFEQLTGFIKTDLKVSFKKNIFIVVEDDNYENITRKYAQRNWSGFFSFIDGKIQGTAKIIDIQLPLEDEFKVLLKRESILKNKKLDIKNFDKLTKMILHYSRKHRISIPTIERELNDLETLDLNSIKNIFNNKFKNITALEELNRMIGLKNIKNEINSILTGVIPSKRKYLKDKASIISNRFFDTENLNLPDLRHLVFSGAPGTGKTEVARLVAEILKEKGILESGHLVKVTRSDLVARYSGQTAPKTYEKIKEAKGGVLFIDEAYSLIKDDHDSFGKEAVDTLIEAMTNLKGEFLVILAGYEQDMNRLLESNEGFASRVKIIKFEDYDHMELAKILELKLKNKKFDTSKIKDKLQTYCSHFLDKYNSNNSYKNGRGIENIVSEISRKLISEKRNIVQFSDFEHHEWFHKKIKSEEDSFKQLIGLESVKQELKNIKKRIEFDKDLGEDISLGKNYIFVGNPGTGKTTVAKQMAGILYKLGVLKYNKLKIVATSELKKYNFDEIQKKTTEILNSSLKGLLFIDEAHQLGTDEKGKKIIETLVPFMTEHKGEFSLILGGYPNKMEEMLSNDPGFKGRFNKTIIFNDYIGSEMLKIFETQMNSQITKKEELNNDLIKAFDEIKIFMKEEFANARTAIDFYNRIIDNLALKKSKEIKKDDIVTVLNLFKKEYNIQIQTTAKNISLKNMIGLSNIKQELETIKNRIKFEIKQNKTVTPRSYIFVGNPGTGKTTVAKQIANMFYEMELLKTNKIQEVTAVDLIGKYLGDTEANTKKILENSIGGLLFIDEAHQLYSPNNQSYGLQAIRAIVPFMTQHQNDFSIIFAGYKKEMQEMLKSDVGLRGRFSKVLEFKDYTTEEMLKIFENKLEYKIENNYQELLLKYFKIFKTIMKKDFANARTVNNFYDKVIDIIAQKNTSKILITQNDLKQAFETIRGEYEN